LFRTGSLGAPGSVGFFFDHAGVVEATHADRSLDIEAAAIEAGAQNVEPLEGEDVPQDHAGARFITEIRDLDAVSKFLAKAGWKVTAAEIRYLAKNLTELTEPQRKEVVDFLNTLDDHDDVHRVYAAIR
jgi:transcriptional/translational regulatory protein YebC/TACO1